MPRNIKNLFRTHFKIAAILHQNHISYVSITCLTFDSSSFHVLISSFFSQSAEFANLKGLHLRQVFEKYQAQFYFQSCSLLIITMNFLVLLIFATVIAISVASKRESYVEKCGSKTPLRYNPKTLFQTRMLGYSQISIDRHSGMVTISGQTSIQVNGKVKGKAVADQMKYVTENLKLALVAIKAQTHSVTRLLVTIVDYNQEQHLSFVGELGRQFGNPAITLLGVSRLAFPNLLVEVEAILYVSRTFSESIGFCKCDGFFIDPECKHF